MVLYCWLNRFKNGNNEEESLYLDYVQHCLSLDVLLSCGLFDKIEVEYEKINCVNISACLFNMFGFL